MHGQNHIKLNTVIWGDISLLSPGGSKNRALICMPFYPLGLLFQWTCFRVKLSSREYDRRRPNRTKCMNLWSRLHSKRKFAKVAQYRLFKYFWDNQRAACNLFNVFFIVMVVNVCQLSFDCIRYFSEFLDSPSNKFLSFVEIWDSLSIIDCFLQK